MSNPLITQRLSREKAVLRYLTALQNGDFTTIDAVWQEAAENPALEQLLFDLHERFPNGQELLASLLEENTPFRKESALHQHETTREKEVGSINSSPSRNRRSARFQRTGQRRWPVLVSTLAAVLLVAFLVGGFLFIHNRNNVPQGASRATPTIMPTPTVMPTSTPSPLAQASPLCRVILPVLYQTNTDLNDMLVLSNSDIWEVGFSQAQPLALHWNGSKWSSVPVPAPNGSRLNRLTALSPNNIWAIGTTAYGNGGMGFAQPGHTLIEHWDGTRWSQTPSPDLLPSTLNLLQGITAVAPNDIWAAGVAGRDIAKSGYGPQSSPLLEHWDGTRWRLVQLPRIPGAGLDSIVALNANDIWTGGEFSTNDGNAEFPLLEHWDGQHWSQASPQSINGGVPGRVLKITADAQHHLWALSTDQNAMPLLLSLSNGQWISLPVPTVAASSPTSTFYNSFRGIYATGPQDIWLAGTSVEIPRTAGDSISTPLVEHWDGHQWQAVPERYQGQAGLQVISVSTGSVWVSGSSGLDQPFIATTCH